MSQADKVRESLKRVCGRIAAETGASVEYAEPCMEDYKARCPKCYTELQEVNWYYQCRIHGYFNPAVVVFARLLPPSPAPPLTQDEVNALQEPVWLY